VLKLQARLQGEQWRSDSHGYQHDNITIYHGDDKNDVLT